MGDSGDRWVFWRATLYELTCAGQKPGGAEGCAPMVFEAVSRDGMSCALWGRRACWSVRCLRQRLPAVDGETKNVLESADTIRSGVSCSFFCEVLSMHHCGFLPEDPQVVHSSDYSTIRLQDLPPDQAACSVDCFLKASRA